MSESTRTARQEHDIDVLWTVIGEGFIVCAWWGGSACHHRRLGWWSWWWNGDHVDRGRLV